MMITRRFIPRLLLLIAMGMAGRAFSQGLVLTADRGTGAMTIRNTSGAAIAIDGYTIGSTNGFLNPTNGAWASFDDANIGNWEEANPTAVRLSELSPIDSLSLAPGQIRSLGNPYNFAPTVFGSNFQNLSFEYATPGGARFQGPIQYSGPHNTLVLTLNRTTGSATIQNQSELAVAIDGYTISSSDGHLNSANGAWTSLDDANVGNWEEANATSQRLSELSPIGSLNLSPGQIRSLGTPYAFAPTVFGNNFQNVTFEFASPTGSRFQGIVQYTGLHNNLVLKVDRTTGSATIVNQSSLTGQVDGYTIASTTGSLLPASWTSFDDQNVGAWEEANNTANRLSELNPTGATMFTPGLTMPLGNLFKPAGLGDLNFEFSLTDGRRIMGVVEYVLPGDYNGNGAVDAADYVVWRKNLGTNNTLPNNVLPGPIGQTHYNQWKANFGKQIGAGAGAGSLAAAAVPEPVSLGAALVGLVFGCASVRTRIHNP